MLRPATSLTLDVSHQPALGDGMIFINYLPEIMQLHFV